MRYVLGSLALIAAVVIVVCSATTLFLTAYYSVTVPWQQWVAGVTIATVVAWEAVALLVIGYCFRKWHVVLGIGTSLALVLAMAVTASMEWKNWIGGRADMSVERSVKADDRSRVRAELERAYARRDALQGLDRLTKFQREELSEVKDRIAKLEQRWDTQTVTARAAGNVEGEAIHDLVGWDARTTQIIIDTLPMWLMMLLRVISIPGAAIAISAMRSEKPQEASGAGLQRPLSLDASKFDPAYSGLSAAPRTPIKALERITGVEAKANRTENSYSSSEVNTSPERVNETGKTEHEELGLNTKQANELSAKTASEELTPSPDGPGAPAPAPEEPKIEEVAARSEKVVSLFRDDGKGPEASRGKKKSHKPEGKVESWLGATTTQVDDPAVKTSSADCWRSYLAYCDTEGKQPMHRKVFSRKLGVLLGRASGKGRKRDSKGSVFTGLMINPVMAAARRRVA